LLELAAKCGPFIHRLAHGHRDVDCGFSPAHLLDAFWNTSDRRAKTNFTSWANAFREQLLRAHQQSPARRAALLLRAQYARNWNTRHLAEMTGVTDAQLRRSFELEHGTTLAAYQR